jgi:hypothetical protein
LHTFEQIGHYMAKEVKEWLTKYLAKT